MSSEPLDRKYRPKAFADVRGQERCVSYLSNLILREAKPRSILLHGSYGSGKTTLARLYSKALNCHSLHDDGSPCGACGPCQQPDHEHRREYNVPEKGTDPELLREWLLHFNRPVTELKNRTLFFDEAHALTRVASDILLNAVEEPQPGVAFVFATTEVEKMRPELLSRLVQLKVMPLPPGEAVAFLREHADKEGMTYDQEALALLAALKNGHPRDLLIGLEQVGEGWSGKITRARVKSVFDIDHIDVLIEYFLALGDGDPVKQMKTFLSWREPTESKLRWVQSFSLALYYNCALSSDLLVDALIGCIGPADVCAIMDRFRNRFGVSSNYELQPLLRGLVEFWSKPGPLAADGAMLLQLAAFHELVNAQTPAEDVNRGQVVRTCAAEAAGPRHDLISLPESFSFSLGEEKYISSSDVREIIRCASFLTQQHGLLFNVSFDVRPAWFGATDEEQAYRLIFDFCKDLPGPDAFYIALVERDQMGLRATVLAHVADPSDHDAGPKRRNDCAALRKWSETWRSEDRLEKDATSMRTLGLKAEHLRDHWNSVVGLCAGLGIEETIDGLDTPLLELLNIRVKDVRLPGAVRGPVFFTSRNLFPAAMKAAAVEKMDFLSAFEDHEWSAITRGWEQAEFIDRQTELRKRRAQVEEVKRTYGPGTSEFHAEVARLSSTWPTDPRDRRRRWIGWWLKGQV